jgi:hypothetical protein
VLLSWLRAAPSQTGRRPAINLVGHFGTGALDKDLAGVPIDYSVTRATGGSNGRLLDAQATAAPGRRIGRAAVENSILHGRAAPERRSSVDAS